MANDLLARFLKLTKHLVVYNKNMYKAFTYVRVSYRDW